MTPTANPIPNDPLAALRPLHLPDPIGWWPPAPGWWVLLVLLLASVWLIVFALRKRYQRNAWRRAALAEINELQTQTERSETDLAADVNTLLRRCARINDNSARVAALTGQQWLEYLDSKLSEPAFNTELGRTMLRAAYDPSATIDRSALIDATRRWLRSQR